MKINILICEDDDTQLINETVNSLDEARFLLEGFEYEYGEMITGRENDNN